MPWEIYSAILSPTQARYFPGSHQSHNQTEARRAVHQIQIQQLSTPNNSVVRPRRLSFVCLPWPRSGEPFDARDPVKPADPIEALKWSLAALTISRCHRASLDILISRQTREKRNGVLSLGIGADYSRTPVYHLAMSAFSEITFGA